jgi:hypothetical protein
VGGYEQGFVFENNDHPFEPNKSSWLMKWERIRNIGICAAMLYIFEK